MTEATATAAPPRAPQKTPPAERESPDVIRQLSEALQASSGRDVTFQQALRVLSAHFNAPYAAYQFDSNSGTMEDRVAANDSAEAAWRRVSEGMLLNARYKNTGCGRLFASAETAHPFSAIAAPIPGLSGEPIGSMMLVVPCRDEWHMQSVMAEFRALVAWIAAGSVAPSRSPAAGGTGVSVSSGLTKASEFESLEHFAFAIANNLKGKMGCDQVCLGLVRGLHVQVLCLSGFDNLYPRSPGVKVIEQAMAECLDAKQSLCYQEEQKWSGEQAATGHRLHRAWHLESGGAPVASIPLVVGESCVAVVSVRNPAGKPFRPDQLQKIGELVSPLAPGLLLLERADRTVLRHTWDSLRKFGREQMRPESRTTRLCVLLLLALLCWTMLGQQPYRITVPCRLKPEQVRHVAAPFEGTIARVLVERGDEVAVGDVLVEMDTEQLRSRRQKLLAERDLAELDMMRALQQDQQAQAMQARARRRMAEANLASVQAELEQAVIRSHVAGVVLTGDLKPRIGEVVPLGEPLLEISPDGSFSIELLAPEHVAMHLAAGQAGEFALNARPDEVFPCSLRRVAPSSVVVNGQNVFVTKCSTAMPPTDWVRAGMEGVARVDAGQRPVWWVWLHRSLDSLRLQLWKL